MRVDLCDLVDRERVVDAGTAALELARPTSPALARARSGPDAASTRRGTGPQSPVTTTTPRLAWP